MGEFRAAKIKKDKSSAAKSKRLGQHSFSDYLRRFYMAKEFEIEKSSFNGYMNILENHLMEESLKNLQEDKTVRIEFYDYPSDSHKYARLAAAYSRCAVQQEVDYLSYIGHLNADYSEWTSMLKESNVSEYLLQAAIKYGADEDMMNLCVIGNEVYQAIDSNVANAAVLGVEGTPSFIIGNHLITGYVSRRTFNSMMNEFSN